MFLILMQSSHGRNRKANREDQARPIAGYAPHPKPIAAMEVQP